ncbi:HtaA domain-containing protein [Brevibacterium sp. BRM-1]|uniref:HtaA domain-containing protein n=1 Tax=Brevibacterium sp. BRM-1 TaxID=2999062 RepID=UPI00228131BD|nr:HtaA domain-containing protein [Brevibacterium sp. BRM-1]WAL40597.1 HtaA domain-containing protein [Brevibacterium sp. BRM-1]
MPTPPSPAQRAQRPRALHAALSLLALIAATVFAPAAAASPAAADAAAQTAHELTWRLRASFDSYTGGGETSDGARVADGVYRFPLKDSAYDAKTRTTTAQFGGTVHYRKWHGYHAACPDVDALDLTFSDMRIVLSPSGSHLYAHAKSRALDETKCDPVPDLGEVELADLDAAAVTPAVGEAGTTWTAIPATLGSGGKRAFAGFYPDGSPLDPVTFSVPEAGGPVADADQGAEPNVPVFKRGETYLPDHKNSLTEMTAASSDGKRLYFTEKVSGGTRQITVLDAQTLRPVVGAQPLPLPTTYSNDDGYYDAAGDRFFALIPENGHNWLTEAAFRNGAWQTRHMHELPADADEDGITLAGLGYDPVSRRALAITGLDGPKSAQPYRAHVIEETASGWKGTDTQLPPVKGYADYTYRQLDSRASDNLMAFADADHAIYTPASTAYNDDRDSVQMPPFVLTIAADRSVTVTPQNDLLFPGDRTRTHDAVKRFDDGTLVLYTRRKRTDQGGPDDALRTVELHGTALSVTKTVRYADANIKLPGTLGEDTGLGLRYTFDTTAASLVPSRAGTELPRTAMPDSVGQSPLDGKFSMAVGPDHSIYYPIRDTTTAYKQYGVSVLRLRGITPHFTRTPESSLVLDGKAAALSARAEGTPRPAITWQVKAPGGTFAEAGAQNRETAEGSGEFAVASDTPAGTQVRPVATNAAGTVYGPATTIDHAGAVPDFPDPSATASPSAEPSDDSSAEPSSPASPGPSESASTAPTAASPQPSTTAGRPAPASSSASQRPHPGGRDDTDGSDPSASRPGHPGAGDSDPSASHPSDDPLPRTGAAALAALALGLALVILGSGTVILNRRRR